MKRLRLFDIGLLNSVFANLLSDNINGISRRNSTRFLVICLLHLSKICFFFFHLQLVDLKAELYRKQEQFKKEKLGQENAGAGSILKPKDKVHEILFSVMKCFVRFHPVIAYPAAHSSLEAKYLE